VRAIHIVVTSDPCDEPEILCEVTAHSFREQLLPSITILGHGGVGVGLSQSDHIRAILLSSRVYARRRRVEIPLYVGVSRSEQHVGIDQDGKHAEGLVVLDEAHTAHIGCQIEDKPCVLHGLLASVTVRKI
jgi:hypothetical protein